MTVRLTRESHGARRSASGIEVDDDGHARSWQTSGHRVGRFARDLSAVERTALADAVASAADADPTAPPPARPSGATEQLTADGLPDLVLDAGATPPAGFADLVSLLLGLREDLADSPVGAIGLEVDGSPLGARLRHLGTDPVVVRMGELTVAATSFDADSAIVDSTTHTVEALAFHGPVEQGWALPLIEDLGVDDPFAGGFLTVSVGTLEVDALGDGVLHGSELSWMTE